MLPRGRLPCQHRRPGQLSVIAAGSGITPIMSMLASMLEQDSANSATLLYGNQRTSSIMFRQRLAF